MKLSTISLTRKNKYYCAAGAILMILLAVASLFVGKYPLSLDKLMAGDALQWRVFLTLRLSRTAMAVIGGFALSVAGFVYQTVFRNPLASPDIIGVSSGASAGAAVGILLLSGTTSVTASAFAGALLAVVFALGLSALDKSGKHQTIVLAGIAVHSLAQTALMALKLTADPDQELAAIEYWIMGSLNGISVYSIGGNLLLSVLCVIALLLLHRQILLLSAEEGEARMLGVPVTQLRLGILLMATLRYPLCSV
jgi:iron complex transport system permease protein